jgi:DNA ligase-1
MFKPMLACSTIPKIEDIKYPVLASHKLDGIRCLIIDGKAVSRSLKPIPNEFIQRELSKLNLPFLDGELLLKGENWNNFNKTQSAVMTASGCPDFEYVVFDYPEAIPENYASRMTSCIKLGIESERVRLIKNEYMQNAEEMKEFFEAQLAMGGEGAIVRHPMSPYKFGRSTMNQGWMLKLKPVKDDEGVIVDYTELMHNDNEATVDNLGNTVRSSHKYNQYAGGTLGALIVYYKGVEFKLGTGYTAEQRSILWGMRNLLIGKKVMFKYTELFPSGKPRCARFKALRDPE